MTHERHADFLQDAGFHQARIERVAEVVKTDGAEIRVFERGLPRTLHDADWLAFVADDQAFGLAVEPNTSGAVRSEESLAILLPESWNG
jgi:hypothetical protein